MPRTRSRPPAGPVQIRKSVRRAVDPAPLIQRFIEQLEPSIIDMIDSDPEAWSRVLDAFERREPGYVSEDDQVAMYEQLAAALPSDELRETLQRYSDSHSPQLAAQCEAGFAIGLAVGLRLREPWKAGAR